MCTFLRSVALVRAVLIKCLSTYGVLQSNIVIIVSLLHSPCTLLQVLAFEQIYLSHHNNYVKHYELNKQIVRLYGFKNGKLLYH